MCVRMHQTLHACIVASISRKGENKIPSFKMYNTSIIYRIESKIFFLIVLTLFDKTALNQVEIDYYFENVIFLFYIFNSILSQYVPLSTWRTFKSFCTRDFLSTYLSNLFFFLVLSTKITSFSLFYRGQKMLLSLFYIQA